MSNRILIWCVAEMLLSPHKITHPELVEELIDRMTAEGWKGDALVGYPSDRHIQLLSGTHRRSAAQRVGIKIPVVVVSRKTVEHAWGDLEAWHSIMASGVLTLAEGSLLRLAVRHRSP